MAERLTIQSAGGGSIPTPSLHFERCSLSDVSQFVRDHHYAHSHITAMPFCFRLVQNRILSGVCLFSMIAGNPKAAQVLKGFSDWRDYLELHRVVLLDEVPKNSESRFIGWCLRWLKANTQIKAIVTFADPAHGHSGIIYRASNWLYLGKQKPDRDRIFIDGVELHPKQVYNHYGTSSLVKLRQMKIGQITTAPREPKHKYVFILRPNLAHLLKYEVKKW